MKYWQLLPLPDASGLGFGRQNRLIVKPGGSRWPGEANVPAPI